MYFKTFNQGPKRRGHWDILTLWVPVTECSRPHVTQTDGAFATAVHKYITLVWMALCSRDDFRQFLHVGRLDVYNIWERRVKGQTKTRSKNPPCATAVVVSHSRGIESQAILTLNIWLIGHVWELLYFSASALYMFYAQSVTTTSQWLYERCATHSK